MVGVETETPENREDVHSALRILMREVENLKLFGSIRQPQPDAKDLRTASGDFNFEGPWRWFYVTRQSVKDMFVRLGHPLPAWLDPEAEPLDSPSNKKGRYSQETLLRIIGGLMM